MTNHHTKLEDPWGMSSLVIDWTRFVYGPTCAKQYTPLFFEEEHKYWHFLLFSYISSD